MPRIPLIEDLTKAPIPAGSNLMVEYDPASQWYNTSFTIAAGWLKNGGNVRYIACGQPTDLIRSKLSRLGVNVLGLEAGPEAAKRLLIRDAYTATLGLKSNEAGSIDTVKVAELSPGFTQDMKNPENLSGSLRILDDGSYLSRFNDERSWVEYYLTRVLPQGRGNKVISFLGFVSGIHREAVYRQLEAAHDGVVDFKLEETGKETVDLIRIRSMRDVGFDRGWHQLKIGENFEVTLEK